MATLAIIGRPNVGKSTLYNRLAGKRQALVDDRPGVTRDRLTTEARLGPLAFTVMDTPGLEEAKESSLEGRMTAQSLAAIAEADALLFLIDAKTGVTAEDEFFARLARKSGKPVILAANKAESKSAQAGYMEAYRLGFGEPLAISAEHGGGMAELCEALMEVLPQEEAQKEEAPSPLRVTIMGRPNAGKSTLINRLLGEDRLLTGPEAGITRDTVMLPFTFDGRELLLADTAGMRRKARISEKLEKMAVRETLTSLQFAEVAILVMDATLPLEKQDNALASLIEQEGRACVIALNKWDLVADKKTVLEEMQYMLPRVMPRLRGVPLMPISAEKGKGLKELMQAVFAAYETWNARIPTAELNRWLEGALVEHTPPLVGGRRFKIRYMTQHKARPPTFVLFVNRSKEAPESYLRYLTNSLRERFGLDGTPIRLLLRSGKNPYADKE